MGVGLDFPAGHHCPSALGPRSCGSHEVDHPAPPEIGSRSFCLERRSYPSQAPQEVQEVLFFSLPERVVSRNHGVGFRWRELGLARTRVGLDRLDEVTGSAIVEEKDPLPEPPEGCRPELIWARRALDNVVGQPRSHSMQEQIGVQPNWLLAKRRARGSSCGQRWRVAQGAADLGKDSAAARAGWCLGCW